jgi:hypothetical protein
MVNHIDGASLVNNSARVHRLYNVHIISDFCLWAPPIPNSTIGDTEQEEVAWCTKPGHGTRLIPNGALKGVQYLVTSEYIQIAGFIDQTQVNMNAEDYGGELDPHGADLVSLPMLLAGVKLTFYSAWESSWRFDVL